MPFSKLYVHIGNSFWIEGVRICSEINLRKTFVFMPRIVLDKVFCFVSIDVFVECI